MAIAVLKLTKLYNTTLQNQICRTDYRTGENDFTCFALFFLIYAVRKLTMVLNLLFCPNDNKRFLQIFMSRVIK